MSMPQPRRVKYLPDLQDSDDETASGLSPKSNNNFANMRIPKRGSELPSLDTDSEDDMKNDNLNCAILNDSFIMSPNKSGQLDSSNSMKSSRESSAVKTKDLSFLNRFDKMALHSNVKKREPFELKLSPSPIPSAKISKNPNPQIVVENATIVDLKSITDVKDIKQIATPSQQQQLQQMDFKTPFRSTDCQPVAFKSNKTSTTETQFAAPQIRNTFSVKRPTRPIRTRPADANEFRSQKVLFQTPVTLSRAPVTCLPNDSITLSIGDSIGDSSGEKQTMKQKPEKDSVIRSKKSLKGAFSTVISNSEKENIVPAKPKIVITPPDSKNLTVSTAAVPTKETVLRINNNEYTILKRLGCGGSSAVYSAQRRDTGQQYALKVVELQGEPLVVEGYLNETKLLAKLQGNVCVVALYDYQLLQKESRLYMVMEKGNSDFNKILQTYKTELPLYELMSFLYQMLQAVNYIHQNGVIHSDLKPANFLMVNGRLKLIDFGIASNIAIDSTSIIKFSPAGTFNYISPEALTDTSTGSSPIKTNQPKIKISTKSDVWSLGCILYLLLYRKTPFSHIKSIYQKIGAISNPLYAISYKAIPPFYPPLLVDMARSCLQHDPKKRPSCADLLACPFHMIIPLDTLVIPPSIKH